MRTLTAKCPTCSNTAIPVEVGRKTTVKVAECGVCKARYEYSAWNLRKTKDGTLIDQVDLVPVATKVSRLVISKD